MSRTQYILGLVAILLVSSVFAFTRNYLEAGWTSRAAIEKSAAQIVELPDEIGDWVCSLKDDLPENARKTLRCHGFINRTYWNTKTGGTVTVAILYGPRGPIAVHTPEICYSGVGTQALGDRRPVEIKTEQKSDHFWTIQFSRDEDPSPSLEVWYAWSAGGSWVASEQPRFWLTDNLYKIQLAGKPSESGSSESDCKGFLRSLIPVLRTRLNGT